MAFHDSYIQNLIEDASQCRKGEPDDCTVDRALALLKNPQYHIWCPSPTRSYPGVQLGVSPAQV